MSTLADFQHQLNVYRKYLSEMMLKGSGSPYLVLTFRRAIWIMETQLKQNRKYLRMRLDLAGPTDIPEMTWARECFERAQKDIDPELGDPTAFERLKKQYQAVGTRLLKNVNEPIYELWPNRIDVIRHNIETKRVIVEIGRALMQSFEFHRFDEKFLRRTADEGLGILLDYDRRDLLAALRLALEIPKDITSYSRPVPGRPAYVEAVEFAIAFIPFVGSAVAAFEAWRGKDLFGYELSDVERGILAASVLLPWAARAVRQGKALYTAERMAQLYGRDAKAYSYSIAMGERLSADAVGLGRLRKAEAMVVAKETVERKFAQEIADTLKALSLKNASSATVKTVEAKLTVAFEKLVAKNSAFAVLDSYAIERIAAKAANVHHLKGQLLEEVLESQVNKWLRDGACKQALGLELVKEPLTFIPGHLIRDVSGRQITDGILAFEREAKLHIVAVFEAKAGKHAARELSIARTTIAKMSKRELREARMEAAEILTELRERARLEGKTINTSLDDVVKTLPTKEEGGQIRRDIERLYESEIYVGSVAAKVEISPTKVKFFGVVPTDVQTMANQLKAQLKEARIKNFEIMGVGLSSKDLTNAANELNKLLKLDIAI